MNISPSASDGGKDAWIEDGRPGGIPAVVSSRQRKSPQFTYDTFPGNVNVGLAKGSSKSSGSNKSVSAAYMLQDRASGKRTRSELSITTMAKRANTGSQYSSPHSTSSLSFQPITGTATIVATKEQRDNLLWNIIRGVVYKETIVHFFPPYESEDLQMIFSIAMDEYKILETDTGEFSFYFHCGIAAHFTRYNGSRCA